jgi:hypothetical protein
MILITTKNRTKKSIEPVHRLDPWCAAISQSLSALLPISQHDLDLREPPLCQAIITKEQCKEGRTYNATYFSSISKYFLAFSFSSGTFRLKKERFRSIGAAGAEFSTICSTVAISSFLPISMQSQSQFTN